MFEVVATMALVGGIASLDCRPTSIAYPLVKIARAWTDRRNDAARVAVVVESDRSSSLTTWPWTKIKNVELVPERGAVLRSNATTLLQPKEIAALGIARHEGSSYALFLFARASVGQNIRVIVDVDDPSVPVGCPMNVMRSVVDTFVEE